MAYGKILVDEIENSSGELGHDALTNRDSAGSHPASAITYNSETVESELQKLNTSMRDFAVSNDKTYSAEDVVILGTEGDGTYYDGGSWKFTGTTEDAGDPEYPENRGDACFRDNLGQVWQYQGEKALPWWSTVTDVPLGIKFVSASISHSDALALGYPDLGIPDSALVNFIGTSFGFPDREVIEVTELRGNNSVEGRQFRVINDRGTWGDWEEIGFVDVSKEILAQKTVVSDTLNFVSSSDCNMTFDADTGLVYVVYLASRTEHGESQDANVLSVFPITQPWRVEHYVVGEAGDTFSGGTISSMFGCNLVNLTDEVRIFTRVNTDNYYYVDFDKTTKTFGAFTEVMISTDDGVTSETFSQDNFNTYLTDNSYSATSNVFMIANIQFFNNKHYTVISGGPTGNGVVAVSEDSCITWQLRGIVPELTAWECDICIRADETMHIINRNKSDNNFFTSYDLGYTFNSGYLLPIGLQRPRLKTTEDNQVMIVYSTDGNRDQFVVSVGTGEDPNEYLVNLEISSEFYTVYPTPINYKGQVYIAYSNGEIFPEYNTSTATKGKDCINFIRIGEVSSTTKYEFKQ